MSIIQSLRVAIACLATMSVLGVAADDVQPDETELQDEILLKDGSLVKGVLKDIRDGVVTLETGFAGSISIHIDQIEALNSHEPATLMLSDDSVLEDQPLLVEKGQLVTTTGEQYDLSELKIANPAPWELGEGYKWSGLVNFAVEIERGNTKTDEWDYKVDTQWLSTEDRWSFSIEGEDDEADGVKTAENWLTLLKYDYFISERTYVGGMGRAKEDKFADIDLRLMAGPHIGHDFFVEPVFTLSAEAGLAYTDEQFVVGEDTDYAAATWDWSITSDYLGGDSQLYINQFGFWNLDETDDITFDTTLGLAFPLLLGLEAAAEILWEYDSERPDDVEEIDETYKLRIGYTW